MNSIFSILRRNIWGEDYDHTDETNILNLRNIDPFSQAVRVYTDYLEEVTD
jgi:hypothetical protein